MFKCQGKAQGQPMQKGSWPRQANVEGAMTKHPQAKTQSKANQCRGNQMQKESGPTAKMTRQGPLSANAEWGHVQGKPMGKES